jgi:hypothetical protein
MMAELRARWEREEIARENGMIKVCTISTPSSTEIPNNIKIPTINDEIIGVEKATTPAKNLPEPVKTVPVKNAEIFLNMGNKGPVTLDGNAINFHDCNISKVITFLQKHA